MNNGTYQDDKGRFIPGNPGKPKGSSKNQLRDKIKTFLNDNFNDEKFATWFESLKAKEKIEVVVSLLPYAVPRLQSIAVTDTDGNDLPPPAIDYTRLSPAALKELLDLINSPHETTEV